MMARTRQPNGASSIYKGADGKWHGRVTVGVKDDGRPDRRHVQAKSRAEVTRKVRDLERQRDVGAVPQAGKVWTVEQWLTHWMDTIAAASVGENALSAYRVAVRVHLVPGVGKHRLTKLQPEHLEKLYAAMQRNGSRPATAHQVHRTIRTALGEAVRRGQLIRNPAELAKAPRVDEKEIEPYSVEEVRHILEAASQRRNSARWAIALALGLRQGEVLGLTWADVKLDEGVLRVRRNRQRPKYRHGCGGTCGRRHAGYCPRREKTRADTGPTKSRAGKRTIGLPDELVALLRLHQAEQERERHIAGDLWQHEGWLFATPTGGPTNPNTDYHHWKRLLSRAGVRESRLHDARHTAATVLLVLGVPERAVMALMGWSHSSMAKRYQHITETVRHDIAKRVGGLLWKPDDEPTSAQSSASPWPVAERDQK